MTGFEERGVSMQYDSASKQDAKSKFRFSCYCCCSKGIRLSCDQCAIAVAHKNAVAYFDGARKECAAHG